MRYGMRYSSAYGAVDDMVLSLDVSPLPQGGAVGVESLFASGYGNRYGILYQDGVKSSHDYIEEGVKQNSILFAPDLDDFTNVFLEDGGDWADADYDPNFNALDFEALVGDQGTVEWLARPSIQIRGDTSSQLSSLSISGLKRFTNVVQVPKKPQWGELRVAISNPSGTTYTVSVYQGTELVCEGSRTGNGVITLDEQNLSGVSGSVTITFTAAVTVGTIFFDCIWPKSYQIHYSTSALSFPRTPEDTVLDDGFSNYFRYTSTRQSAGTYNVAIVSVSDTNTARTTTAATGTWELVSIPGFPIRVSYYDGNSTNTRIRFTAPDANSTYNIYTSQTVGGPIDMSATAATETAGSGEHIVALPSFGAGITGTHRILVRTVSTGGDEEKGGYLLEIEYSSGTRLRPRPNTPTIKSVSKSGRTLTVVAVYDDTKAKTPASYLQLFVQAYGTALNYTSAQDQQEISVGYGGRVEVTLSYAVASDGFYTFGIRAADIAGLQDTNVVTFREWLGTAVPTDVASASFRVSRGG